MILLLTTSVGEVFGAQNILWVGALFAFWVLLFAGFGYYLFFTKKDSTEHGDEEK